MSYTIQETQRDLETRIFTALNEQNVDALYALATILKADGDDEGAEELLETARRIDRQDWAYDESISN